MNGFGVKGKANDPYYSIKDAVLDWNPANYGLLAGPATSFLFAILLLFTGALTDKINRKCMILFAGLGWSTTTFLASYCDTFNQMLTLRVIQGGCYAFFGPAAYSLNGDFFPKEQRMTAFSLYAILTNLGDSISALTITIIDFIGWRNSYKLCGAFGYVACILWLFFVKEPKRGDDEPEVNEKEKKDKTLKLAQARQNADISVKK